MSALNEFDKEVWNQPSIHKIVARAMARPDAQTFKFTGEMVLGSKPLWDWAEYVVDHYVGSFELMVSFRTQARLGRQLSQKQLAAALNTLLNCWRRSLKEQAKLVAANVPADVANMPVDFTSEALAAKPVFKTRVARPVAGTYTFVDANEQYRVIRFWSNKDNTNTYVSYQYGPDNTSDFAKCGRIDANGDLVVWGSAFPKGDKPCIDHSPAQRADLFGAIVYICSMEREGQLKAGEAYALKSGNCFICNRELTIPSSISAGIGPVCAKKWGV